jgi:hypothetical protein
MLLGIFAGSVLIFSTLAAYIAELLNKFSYKLLQLDFLKLYIYYLKLIMDSIIAAASVIAAGLSIGLSAIGPGIGQERCWSSC